MREAETHLVPTMTHGRMLVREARRPRLRGVLVGFHGYMENAAIQMQRLEEIPDSSHWTLVCIQGLHRFYRGRTEEVVASWMTREDRDAAIADNVAYVAASLEAVPTTRQCRSSMPDFHKGSRWRSAPLRTAIPQRV